MIQDYIGKKVLITTGAYFIGPDGKEHRAIWGTLDGIHKVPREYQPPRGMANWYYEIAGMCVMGCQVNYIGLCPEKPSSPDISTFLTKDFEVKETSLPNAIYIAHNQ
jgi:hypothetical protein